MTRSIHETLCTYLLRGPEPVIPTNDRPWARLIVAALRPTP